MTGDDVALSQHHTEEAGFPTGRVYGTTKSQPAGRDTALDAAAAATDVN